MCTQDTELISLRIGENNPRLGTLADVYSCGSKAEEATHLAGLVVWSEVEVKTVFGCLGSVDPQKQKTRNDVSRRSDLEHVWMFVVDDHPVERFPPPLAQGGRVFSVNRYLLPFETHGPMLRHQLGAARPYSVAVPYDWFGSYAVSAALAVSALVPKRCLGPVVNPDGLEDPGEVGLDR